MESETFSPLWVFISSFAVSSCAGLAALLRSGVKLSWLGIASALLNSGLLGLGIALLWYTRFRENIYFLIGVCLLAGLGGMTTVDFVLSVLRKGGFNLRLSRDGGPELPGPDGPGKEEKGK